MTLKMAFFLVKTRSDEICFFYGVRMFSVLIGAFLSQVLKEQKLTCRFVFQIYTGCYDGSVQAVKLNLLQNYRCWVREGRVFPDDVRVTRTTCVVDGARFAVFRPLHQ